MEMCERRLVITVFERAKLLQHLKESGIHWVEGDGILDTLLVSMVPNTSAQSNKVYNITPIQTDQFCRWIRNLGLEDALFYKGSSHIGSRFDTEVFQTIYPQFNIDNYIENSEDTINRFGLEQILKLLKQFTWDDIVFIALD